MRHFVCFSRDTGLHLVPTSMDTRFEVRGNEAICAISFIDSESMIPDDSTLAATSISSGRTAVASLALVGGALVILSPELFGFPREYDELASVLGEDISNASDALGYFARMFLRGDINRINKDVFSRGRDGEHKQLLLASSIALSLLFVTLLLLCLFLLV